MLNTAITVLHPQPLRFLACLVAAISERLILISYVSESSATKPDVFSFMRMPVAIDLPFSHIVRYSKFLFVFGFIVSGNLLIRIKISSILSAGQKPYNVPGI